MIDVLRLGSLLVVFTAVGMQVLRLLGALKGRAWLEVLASAFLLGLGAVSGVCFLVSLAGVQLTLVSVTSALVGFAVAVEALIRLGPGWCTQGALPFHKPTGGLSLLEGCLLALAMAATVYVFVQAMVVPLHAWDTWAMWSLKAKVLLHETVRSTTYFERPALGYSHPDYPLLVPLVQTVTWLALGRADQVLVLLPFAVLFAAFQVVLYYRLRDLAGATIALVVVAGISWVPLLVRQAPSGLADVPLMVFHGVGLLCLLSWIAGGRRGDLGLAIAFGACAAFTKNEGLALVVVNATALLLVALMGPERKRMFKGLGLYLAATLLCLGPWLAFRLTVCGLGQDLAGGVEGGQLSRVPTIGWAVLCEMARWQNWALLWPVFAACLIVGYRGLRGRENVWCLSVWVLQVGVYVLAYVMTERELDWHIRHSLDRLLMQTLPAVGVLMALQMKGMLQRGKCEAT